MRAFSSITSFGYKFQINSLSGLVQKLPPFRLTPSLNLLGESKIPRTAFLAYSPALIIKFESIVITLLPLVRTGEFNERSPARIDVSITPAKTERELKSVILDGGKILRQARSTTQCIMALILCFYSVFVPQLIGQDIGLSSAKKETKKGLVPPQQLISSGCMYIGCP